MTSEPADTPSTIWGKLIATAIFAVVAAAAVAIWWQVRAEGQRRETLGSAADAVSLLGVDSQPTIAVVPLQNLSGDADLAYLGMAIADEIVARLSRVEVLAVRPLSATASYTTAPIDLAEVGFAVGAGTVVAGHYSREGPRLNVTMEAVEVPSNRLLWRDGITVLAGDVLDVHEQLAEKIDTGLVSSVAPTAEVVAAVTSPRDAEAYEILLKSLAIGSEPGADQRAIEMLERAAALDPGYARIWSQLARRQLERARNGGDSANVDIAEALGKAVALDPDDPLVSFQRVVSHVEAGEVAEALRVAGATVQKYPENAATRFVRSYARRYASLTAGAIEDCEMALALDPRSYRWRACSIVFAHNGDQERADTFLDLDPTSLWSLDTAGHQLLAAGYPRRALQRWERLPADFPHIAEHELVGAVVTGAGEVRIERLTAVVVAAAADERDAESMYMTAEALVFAGAVEEGYRQVRRAIGAGYCSTTALEKQQVWSAHRQDPDFLETLRLARECRDRLSSASS